MTFQQHVRAAQRRSNSLLCIGLDTDQRLLPVTLRSRRNGIIEFNRRIIEATSDLVCAYKLNLAFYEATGARCWENVHRTLDYVPSGVITIGDGKRGDIANTAEQQARLLFDDWRFTAVTVNPYMGRDAVEPFLSHSGRGVFLLAVTSNPGSLDFQRLPVKGRPFFEHVVTKAAAWNTRRNIGLVVGATHSRELRRVRELAPTMPFLIPGVGAQQGDLAATVRNGCDDRGELALINVGRSILYASSGQDFVLGAREAALRYRDQINALRGHGRA